ncbi:MAG: hypothetical protein RIG77_25210 [Cyclobacteriaceae bacterium]
MEDIYLGIGSRVRHSEWGVGIVVQVTSDDYMITFVNHGNKEMSKQTDDLEIIELVEPSQDLISLQLVEETLGRMLSSLTDTQELVDLGDKWIGGKLVFHPGNPDLKPYELPVDSFFHKIVMVRDRLRVMEQRVNSSKLSDEEKVNLQQYITRIYGSLTSFNILFKYREDGFKGSGG